MGCREETSFSIDQHRAPAILRHAYDDMMSGFDILRTYDDLGDLKVENTVDAVLNGCKSQVELILSGGQIPLLLGGAHTLTLGSLRGVHAAVRDYSLIYFDAHPDLMPHPQINYGSSLYYGLVEKIVDPSRLALIGVRQIERAEQQVIDQYKIFTRTALDFEERGSAALVREICESFPPPYALSIDLDSIEPSHCPGVTTPYPGGLMFREVLFVARELSKRGCVYIDIVELSPANDRNNETARIAAMLMASLAEVAVLGRY